MSVYLEPSPEKGLVFVPNDPSGQRQTLTVRNDNNEPVAFKVKTTAPKQYCVRPNSGRIEPGQTTSIQVQLQGFKGDIPTKCKDKFLILSAGIPADFAAASVADYWSHIDSTSSADRKSIVKEQKIRCSYAATTEEAQGPGAGAVAAAAPTPISPSKVDDDRYHTVKTQPSTNGSSVLAGSAINGVDHASRNGASIGEEPAPAYESPRITREAPTPESGASPVVPSAPVAAAAPVAAPRAQPAPVPVPAAAPVAKAAASSGPSSDEFRQLEAKLRAAQTDIQRLQAEVAAKTKEANEARESARLAKEEGLRLRNTASSSAAEEKVAPAQLAKAAQASGVPIHVVAGLVAGTFAFTWLFF